MRINQSAEKLSAQKTNKPWRDEKGNLKSDEELKEMATHWAPSTWEAYLHDIEMGENVESSPEDEVLFAHPNREDIFSSDNSLRNFISGMKIQYFPKLREALKQVRQVLSKQQHEIVILHFWEDLNQVQIAQKLEISPQQVFIQLERALGKIRTKILKEFFAPEVIEPQIKQKNDCLIAGEATTASSKT